MEENPPMLTDIFYMKENVYCSYTAIQKSQDIKPFRCLVMITKHRFEYIISYETDYNICFVGGIW